MGSERVRYDWVINIIMFYLLSPFLTLPVTSRQELFQIFDWIEELKKSGTDCSLFPFLSRSILGFSLSCWKRLATLGSLEFWLPAGFHQLDKAGGWEEGETRVFVLSAPPDWQGTGNGTFLYIGPRHLRGLFLSRATAPTGFSVSTHSPCPFRPRSSNSIQQC